MCSKIGVATSLLAAQPTNFHAFPGTVRDASVHQKVPTQWVTTGNFPGVKVTETCNFHSSEFNIKLKKAWRCTSNHSYVSMACFLLFFIYYNFISSLYMFRAHVVIVRRAKLYYAVSGIITPNLMH